MPITAEQAVFLKKMVSEDANLNGYNLKLKEVPDYYEWLGGYETQFPEPSVPIVSESTNEEWMEYTKKTRDWEFTRDSAWLEAVNQSILPENVEGACVIGGFTIAALKAGWDVRLIDLIPSGKTRYLKSEEDFRNALGAGMYSLPTKTSELLSEFTGLSFEELTVLQSTNDAFSSVALFWTNPTTGKDEKNPYTGKPDWIITRARRIALKKKIDSFVV